MYLKLRFLQILNITYFSHSRKQHQYHSQRQTRPDNQLRPVSNYYEYESVQSVLGGRNLNRQNGPQQLAGSQQTQNAYVDANSNSLPRVQQVQGRHTTASRTTPHPGRGPFVTQVTIGKQHQQTGTKV